MSSLHLVFVLAILLFVVTILFFQKKKRPGQFIESRTEDRARQNLAPSPHATGPGKSAPSFDGNALSLFLDRLLPPQAAAGDVPQDIFARSTLPRSSGHALEQVTLGAAGNAILSRLENPAIDIKTLAALAGDDPILTGNILKLANSPLFGGGSQISSLESAVAQVGFGNLKTLLCIEIVESAATKAGLSPALRKNLWDHIGKTASLARILAPAFPELDPAILGTMGILHDVGKLILYGSGTRNFFDSVLEEEVSFGTNHALAGWIIATNFNMPKYSCNAIRLHHAPAYFELEDIDVEPIEIRYSLALTIANEVSHFLTCPKGHQPQPILESYHFLIRRSMIFNLISESNFAA